MWQIKDLNLNLNKDCPPKTPKTSKNKCVLKKAQLQHHNKTAINTIAETSKTNAPEIK